MAQPKVSVAMSVHNGAEYLQEAIDSILAQTFSDFEFVILDDGSTDAVPDILAAQKDPRIRLLRNEKAGGLAAGLNQILQTCTGEYIARMDGDDIAVPERFEMQVRFLDEHPEIAAVSAAFVILDMEAGKDTQIKRRAENPSELRWLLSIASQLPHPVSMYRRRAALEAGLYRPRLGIAEDFDFWLRMRERFPLANLSPVLLHLRFHPARVSTARFREQLGYSKLALMLAYERKVTGRDSLDDLSDLDIQGLIEGRTPEPRIDDPAVRARVKREWERINYWHDPSVPERSLIKRLKRWPGDLEAWAILLQLVKVRTRWRLKPVRFRSLTGEELRS